jgi:hypothetical protein
MSTDPSDEDLGRRLQELGARESAGAPGLERVLRGRGTAAPRVPGWRRPAAALAAVSVVATLAWCWPTPPHPRAPSVARLESPPADPVEAWALPSDGLLAEPGDEGGRREEERLSREIEGLLRP